MDYCLQRDVQLDLRGLDVAPGCTLLSHSLEKKTEVAFCPAGQILVEVLATRLTSTRAPAAVRLGAPPGSRSHRQHI